MSVPQMSPNQLQRAFQRAAQCDESISSEDWLRAFRYEPAWANGIAMGKYDNGAGDNVIAFFGADGKTVVKGFDHESEVSPHARDEYGIWPSIYEGIPADILQFIRDEAAEYEDVTFCYWSVDGKSWQSGSAVIAEGVDDGSAWLLEMIQMDADQFVEWAKSYYEEDFDRLGESGVRTIFEGVALGR
jgi:hypothetical protein